MQKRIIPAIIIVSLATITLVIILTRKQQTAEAEKATLFVEYGDVQISSDNENYHSISGNESGLDSGTYVKTALGSAQVLLPDNSLISLDENTIIQVNYSKAAIRISQIFGNTWHRVKKLTENTVYKVTTETAVAAVRGTEFGIAVSASGNVQETEVVVAVSRVTATQVLNKHNLYREFTTKDVTSGRYCKISDPDVARSWVVTDIPGDVAKSRWFMKQKALSGLLLQADPTKPLSDTVREVLQNSELVKFRMKVKEVVSATAAPGQAKGQSDYSGNNSPGTIKRHDRPTNTPIPPTPTPNPAYIRELTVLFRKYFINSTKNEPVDFCRTQYYGKSRADILPLFVDLESKYSQPARVQYDLGTAIDWSVSYCRDLTLTDAEISKINKTIPPAYDGYYLP